MLGIFFGFLEYTTARCIDEGKLHFSWFRDIGLGLTKPLTVGNISAFSLFTGKSFVWCLWNFKVVCIQSITKITVFCKLSTNTELSFWKWKLMFGWLSVFVHFGKMVQPLGILCQRGLFPTGVVEPEEELSSWMQFLSKGLVRLNDIALWETHLIICHIGSHCVTCHHTQVNATRLSTA